MMRLMHRGSRGMRALPTMLLAAALSGMSSRAASQIAPFTLLVEPMSAEWEGRLVPPLLQNLLRIAPYATARMEAAAALRMVAGSNRHLALLRRSSATAAGVADSTGLELLEIGPASCLVLVTRPNAIWRTYADLNYSVATPPLRIEAVSPGAQRDVERLLASFPLAPETSLLVRPTHVAIQRLVAGDSDVVAIDAPRRGASDQPPEVMDFALSRNLRLLDPPPMLDISRVMGGRLAGDVVVSKGWFWESPRLYRSVCDPFVLAMPAVGADHLIHALYSGGTATSSGGGATAAVTPAAPPGASPRVPASEEQAGGLWLRFSAAWGRLLTALGLRSP